MISQITGDLTPVAVESSDGNYVVYSSWHQIAHPKPDVLDQGLKDGDPIGAPSLRVYDDSTGKDELLEVGAFSPALSLDGRLAFLKGDSNLVRMNTEYTGEIVVGAVDGKSFEPWTSEPAKYLPYAWAGSTLLAYKALPDSEATDLYAFTGPGESRLLASAAFVIALSPDASRVLVVDNRRTVEVIRIADGEVEASMALDGPGVADYDSSTTPHALSYSGSWYGDRAVAESDAGLVVLDLSDGIKIESVFDTPGFEVSSPTFLDETDVVGWTDLGSPPPSHSTTEPSYDNALIDCDLSAETCEVGPSSVASVWQRWVVNPSR